MASAIDGWAGYSSEITSIIITSIIQRITWSPVYIKNDDDGNNTPFFLIPVALMLLATYFLFPIGVFSIQIITAFASFSAHVYIDNRYHIAGSPLLRFEWFRRKQQLHFVHHTHGNSNFAIIDNFWDRF